MLRSRIDNKALEKGIAAISISHFALISNITRNRYLKVPDKHAAANLTTKSGISNHAAADIRDDPCLSKFGALPECVRKPADNFRTFVCVPYGHL